MVTAVRQEAPEVDQQGIGAAEGLRGEGFWEKGRLPGPSPYRGRPPVITGLTRCVICPLQDSMRAYNEAHPDSVADEHIKSVLTKAERQLKDKFDGRPTKPPP